MGSGEYTLWLWVDRSWQKRVVAVEHKSPAFMTQTKADFFAAGQGFFLHILYTLSI
jgi:hypothetical protein